VPTVPPSTESSLDETPDFGMSIADETGGDPWVLRLGPEYTR
jgi:hypothetical protein